MPKLTAQEFIEGKLCTTSSTKINDLIGIISDKGNISDGHHTFDELYEHRTTLFIALCRELYHNPQYMTKKMVWRKPVEDGWFLMGINTKMGEQISYHLPESRWEETKFIQIDPVDLVTFDGHNSNDVLKRLKEL